MDLGCLDCIKNISYGSHMGKKVQFESLLLTVLIEPYTLGIRLKELVECNF